MKGTKHFKEGSPVRRVMPIRRIRRVMPVRRIRRVMPVRS